MKMLRNILYPFTPFYFLGVWLRNKAYDVGLISSKTYDFPVVCIGNLSVGGTGKSPMIEYLIRFLKDDFKVATLSRGYKRKTKGFLIANNTSTAETIGDEPYQFYKKFEDVIISVDADRQNGLTELRKLPNPPEVILLDDAYQHRKVEAGFNILLTTYDNLFVNDMLLPTGDLREPKSGADRADVIVVTKCPNGLTSQDKDLVKNKIMPRAHQHVFFSTIQYAENVVSKNKALNLNELNKFTLVTGIANPNHLTSYLSSKALEFEHLNFNDHHTFSKAEVGSLSKNELIVTTEKDYMRLMDYQELQDKLFYLPIEASIDNNEFNNLIKSFVVSTKH